MNLSRTYEIGNDISELNRLNSHLEQLAEDWNIPEKPLFQINLAVDELVTNIINYGYEGGQHKIILIFSLKDDAVTIQIQDQGKAFNPLTTPEPDISEPTEKRKIGGLGIHLTKTLMDSIEYERIDDSNIVMLIKKIR